MSDGYTEDHVEKVVESFEDMESAGNVDPSLVPVFVEHDQDMSSAVDRLEEAQEKTIFSRMEYLVVILFPGNTLEEISEILGIDFGNVRGKWGRISDKIDRARKSTEVYP